MLTEPVNYGEEGSAEVDPEDFVDDPLANEEADGEELEEQEVMTGREQDFVKAFEKLEQQDAAEGIIDEDDETPDIAFDAKQEKHPSEPISQGFPTGQDAVTEAEVRKEANVEQIGASQKKAEAAARAAVAKQQAQQSRTKLTSHKAGTGGAKATTDVQNKALAKSRTASDDSISLKNGG